jgi:hypothetical protein
MRCYRLLLFALVQALIEDKRARDQERCTENKHSEASNQISGLHISDEMQLTAFPWD